MKYFETVYLVPVGSETVKHENARQTAFYSPLIQSETQDLVTIGKPIHASYHCVVYWKSLLHTHSWKQTGIMHRGDDQCSTHLSSCLSLDLNVYLSIYLYVCLSYCLYIYLSVFICVFMSV